MMRTISSSQSSRLPRSSPDEGTSFPDLEPAGGMVDEPVPSDTRLSRVPGRIAEDTRIQGRRLYLYDINGRGPEPRRHRGAVLAPRQLGRGLQGKSLIKHSMCIPSVITAYKGACHHTQG
jgi:hypothetical protein